MKEVAAKKHGKCLSSVYINSTTKLIWECKYEHQWEATPGNVINQNSWCPFCVGRHKTIKDMQRIASQRGGKCISVKYIDAKTKLTWECAYKHQWQSKPNDILTGYWCPICCSSLGERICREYFQQIFKAQFPRSYPKWLINSRGNQMELDGFCAKLNLSFEHHGEQHYKVGTWYVTSEYSLNRRKADDDEKIKLCQLNGVHLIVIPEVPRIVSISKLKEFLKYEFEKRGITIPEKYDKFKINLKRSYTTNYSEKTLTELKVIAKRRGGKCLSDTYVYALAPLLWECAKGHHWKATAASVKNGSWCKKCAGTARSTIEECHRMARERNGKCLSNKYINNRYKLLWECENGHRWESTPNHIQQGRWCPKCRNKLKGLYKLLTIEEMHEIAKNRNGKCLATNYHGNRHKLIWECSEGHQWEATPMCIKQGTWCPVCANKNRGNKKITLEIINKIAEKKGGRCLSNVYEGQHTKMLWECNKGHRWMTTYKRIKNGSWCPECYSEKFRKCKAEQQSLSVAGNII